jgi:outer membrane beta-barrel protein
MSLRTRWSARRIAAGMMAVAFALIGGPAGAGAQETDDERASGIELMGSIGALTPLARLADSGDTITAELSTRVAFGAELDYWFGSFGIGVVGGYSNPELTIQIRQEDDIGFPLGVQLGAADYWTFTGNLMWRPQLSGSSTVVRPYFGVGAGVVSITYPQSDDFPDIESETRFAGTILGGAQVALSKGWFLRLDVRDYISQFNTEPFRESKMQHDLMTSFGIGYAFH